MPTRITRRPEEEESAPCVLWAGASRRVPIVLFHPEAVLTKESSLRSAGECYRLTYKMVRTDSRLVRSILSAHGFLEVNANSNDFNLMWTGSHVKPHLLRSLAPFQRVNHFPRSYELTRKDRLYKNVQRMQQTHGQRHFNLLPPTYLLPGEYQEFCNAFSKDRGPWIVKPVASSRGRGVYLVNSPAQVNMEDNILVSRYISNPLLIDGFKFDVRLYVVITSYDPLVIYLYEEGLTRFATVRYDRAGKNIKNQFMHLTNYSVNKKSGDYVSCDDPEVEDYGNKWSMSAMLRYLKQEGKDTAGLMSQVEDLIIKTIIAGELPIATACKSFLPHRSNCFELYGFDVLIDDNLKPWLLEVNLSPSLACDAPLDLKVKACMISDMLTLIGLECQDPQQRLGRGGGALCERRLNKSQRQRPLSASDIDTGLHNINKACSLGLSTEEVKALRRVQEEAGRRGGFVCIFPRQDTWSLYGSFLEHRTSMNYMLANHLFPDKTAASTQPKLHAALYERKLLSLHMRKTRRRSAARRTGWPHPPESSANEEEEEEEEDAGEVDKQEEMQEVPVCPTPAPPTPPPRVSILEALQKGENLSKVQARWAFSTFLQRVENRLRSQQDHEKPLPKEEEQMELVMKFLHRAARNLQRSVSLTLPSRSLPFHERRNILAKQLGEFISLYNQETQQMASGDVLGVNPAAFQTFIAEASEYELEEVLTFYTHKNKSATVFLGSSNSGTNGAQHAGTLEGAMNRKAEQANYESVCAPGNGVPDPPVTSSSGVSVCSISSDGKTTQLKKPSLLPPEHQLCTPLPGSRLHTLSSTGTWAQPVPRSQSCTLGTSSFQSAAQIYTQRLSRPNSSRPASAQSSALRSRCSSAGSLREGEDPYNMGAVTASLQRLAERQATRSNVSQLRQITQQLTHLNLASGALTRAAIRLGGIPRAIRKTATQTCTETKTKNGPHQAWDQDMETNLCSSVTGPTPHSSQHTQLGQSVEQSLLQPTPPSSQKLHVARKLSASRSVRVSACDGAQPSSDPLAQGALEPSQVIFARSRPPVPPPRTTGGPLKKKDTVLRPT
ncbi:tubulin polyglutamylase TTLL5 isoform X2 [Hyperolius riggenbachi]|uniref:tubulin polyglutamylase TTLL5 isoform X2 n=1 Tax=Hyperolius riggenbachi TaxID=752182 RepID=UPI0035A32D5A